MRPQNQDYVAAISAMTDTDCAYLAGIIDGEGSIFIAHQLPCTRKGGKRRMDCHTLTLAIGMTDKPTIDWIISKIGARMRNMTFGQRNGLAHIRTPAYLIRCCSQHCVEVLQKTLPYLICKRAEAELGIEFYQTTKWEQTFGTGANKGRLPLPQEVIDIRSDYCVRMHDLKPRSVRTKKNRELRAAGLLGPPES